MKPVDFKESNKELQKPKSMTDEECISLKVFNDGHRCVSCWKPSWKEWFSFILFRKIWVHILSGETQPPIYITSNKSNLIDMEK